MQSSSFAGRGLYCNQERGLYMRELLELLEHDARRPVGELAAMLKRSEYEVEKNIKDLEKNKIILSYNTLINWEKFGDDTVTAIIEINLTPQREVGFDAIAERIYRFDEVRTVYLMSGKVIIILGFIAGLFGIAGNYIGVSFFNDKGAKAVKPIMIVVLTIFFIRILTEIV